MGDSGTKRYVKAGRIDQQGMRMFQDQVAAERQFLIKTAEGDCFSVNCTPENLEDLALGQLFFHGCIENAAQAEKVEVFPEKGEIQVQTVRTWESKKQAEKKQGKADDPADLFQTAEKIFSDPGPLFTDTGCAHACVLYRRGEILCRREDIGRHNALDKIIGYGLKKQIDFGEAVVFTTGRVSGDYMGKIVKSGIKTVVSRAAVTDEAIKAARDHGITLYGFVRKGEGNLYSPQI